MCWWVWLGFGSLLILLVPGLGVINLHIALLVVVVDRIDVTVRCVVLTGFGMVGGTDAPVAAFMGLLFWCHGLVGASCVSGFVCFWLRCVVVVIVCGVGAAWDKVGKAVLNKANPDKGKG